MSKMGSVMGTLSRILRLPRRARRGQPIQAKEWNKIREALVTVQQGLLRMTVRPSDDIGVRQTTGGTMLFLKKRAAVRKPRVPFRLHEVVVDGVNQLYVEPGLVIEEHVWGVRAERIVPKLGGIFLDTDPRPYFTIASLGDGAKELWARKVDGTWEVHVETALAPDVEEMQWKLAEFTITAGRLDGVSWQWGDNVIFPKTGGAMLTPAQLVAGAASGADVIFNPAQLFYQSPAGTGHRPVMIGASSTYADPPPVLALAGAGPWDIWIEYQVDEHGQPTTDPVLQEGDPGSAQAWIPPTDGAGGQTGYVNQHVGTISRVDGKAHWEPVNACLIARWDWGAKNLGSGAKVAKGFNATTKSLELRTHVAKSGSGLSITEVGDEIEHDFDPAAAEGSHPWKVMGKDDGTCDVGAGFVLGYHFDYSGAAVDTAPAAGVGAYSPDTIVMGFGAEYAGGNHAVTGTRYIYAEVERNSEDASGARPVADDEYAEAYVEATLTDETMGTTVELFDDILPDPAADSVTIVLSATAPSSYSPSSGKYAVCIAKVTNTAGTVTVDKQYVTHNPEIFVPVVNVVHDVANLGV